MKIKKVGGIWFFTLWRMQFSFCVKRKPVQKQLTSQLVLM